MILPNDRRAATRSLPVWMAALLEVGRDGIDWQCIAGRAVYTNPSARTVVLQPLGVHVPRAHTVIVSWKPGETAYTIELHRTDALAA